MIASKCFKNTNANTSDPLLCKMRSTCSYRHGKTITYTNYMNKPEYVFHSGLKACCDRFLSSIRPEPIMLFKLLTIFSGI